MKRKSSHLLLILFCIMIFVSISIYIIAFAVDKDKYNVESISCQVNLTKEGDMIVKEKVTCTYPKDMDEFCKDYSGEKYFYNKFGYISGNSSYIVQDSESVKVFCDDRLMIDTATITKVTKENSEVFVGFSSNHDTILHNRSHSTRIESDKSGFKRVIIWGKKGFKGKMAYEFNYTVRGAVTQYADYSVLSWRFYNKPDTTLKSVDCTILAPRESNLPIAEASRKDFLVNGYGFDKGINKRVGVDGVHVSAYDVNKNEYFEVRTLMPNRFFSNMPSQRIAERTILGEFEKEDARMQNLPIVNNHKRDIGFIVTLAVSVLIGLCICVIWSVYGQKLYVGDGMLKVCKAPNKLPPAFISQLSLKGLENKDISATLMDLARRDYIRIVRDNDFRINLVNNDFSKLKSYEARLLRFIFHTVGGVDIDKMSSEEVANDYISVEMKKVQRFAQSSNFSQREQLSDFFKMFKEDVKNDVESYGYIDNKFKKAKNVFMLAFLPILANIIVNIVCILATSSPAIMSITFMLIPIYIALGYGAFLTKIKRRTQAGEKEYYKWEQFKKYMLESAAHKNGELKNLENWESNLVYAVSFGIADGVMDEFFIDINDAQYPTNNYYFCGCGRYRIWDMLV